MNEELSKQELIDLIDAIIETSDSIKLERSGRPKVRCNDLRKLVNGMLTIHDEIFKADQLFEEDNEIVQQKLAEINGTIEERILYFSKMLADFDVER